MRFMRAKSQVWLRKKHHPPSYPALSNTGFGTDRNSTTFSTDSTPPLSSGILHRCPAVTECRRTGRDLQIILVGAIPVPWAQDCKGPRTCDRQCHHLLCLDWYRAQSTQPALRRVHWRTGYRLQSIIRGQLLEMKCDGRSEGGTARLEVTFLALDPLRHGQSDTGDGILE